MFSTRRPPRRSQVRPRQVLLPGHLQDSWCHHRQACAHDVQAYLHGGPETTPSVSPCDVVCGDAAKVDETDDADNADEAAKGEDGGEAEFLGGANFLQVPDDGYGNCDDCEIGEDIHCACSDVKRIIVDALPTGDCAIPEIRNWSALSDCGDAGPQEPGDNEEADKVCR